MASEEKTRITISYSLHPYPLKEKGTRYGWKQIKAEIRAYYYGVLKARFAVFVYDGEQPIYANPSHFKGSQFKLDAPNSVRYNLLLKSIRARISEVITSQLEVSPHEVNKDAVKEEVKTFCKTYHADLSSLLKREFAPKEDVEKLEYSLQIGNIDKQVWEEFKKETSLGEDKQPLMLDDLETALIHKQVSYSKQIDQEKIKSLSTEEKYKQGHFNKDDIFEIFGSLYFDKDLKNRENLSIVIKLIDYKVNAKPKANKKLFNLKWAQDFFTWLNATGFYEISSKGFDPLNYKESLFQQNKKREAYQPATFAKQVAKFKLVSEILSKKGLLPKVDFDELSPLNYVESIDDAPRKKHYINKNEFDKWLGFKFDKGKEEDYKKLLPELRKSGIIKGKIENDVSIKTLNAYRDGFALMVMVGGLRGLDEYNSCEILDYDDDGKVIRLHQNKTGLTITNPMNKYTVEIIERHKGKLPVLKNGETLIAYIKIIAHIIGLNRVYENKDNVKENISTYWARKSFGNMLFQMGVPEEHIILFTGHESKLKTTLGKSYLDFENVELKRDILRKINLI